MDRHYFTNQNPHRLFGVCNVTCVTQYSLKCLFQSGVHGRGSTFDLANRGRR